MSDPSHNAKTLHSVALAEALPVSQDASSALTRRRGSNIHVDFLGSMPTGSESHLLWLRVVAHRTAFTLRFHIDSLPGTFTLWDTPIVTIHEIHDAGHRIVVEPC